MRFLGRVGSQGFVANPLLTAAGGLEIGVNPFSHHLAIHTAGCSRHLSSIFALWQAAWKSEGRADAPANSTKDHTFALQ